MSVYYGLVAAASMRSIEHRHYVWIRHHRYTHGRSMSVVVRVVICSLISIVVVILGIGVFHAYERYAFAPQLPVLFVLIGVAGTHFYTSAPSLGTGSEKSADRMSFFFLCLSGALAWAPAAADFYVYYPLDSNRLKVLLSTTTGLGLSCIMMSTIGVGNGTGVSLNPA